MDWTACSRETERDYTWDNAHASSSLSSFARDTLAPAFEGSLTTSRFAALLRCPDSPNGVILGVSVSTERVDFRHRPIRTMAFFRAENPDEETLLASFFAECLRKKDEETIPESSIAKAVESLYQSKKKDEFIKFCKELPKADDSSAALTQRWAIPRDNLDDRKKAADALTALTKSGSPFLLALTDRLPTDVLASLGSMFDRGTVWIFSKATSRKERLPDPPQKYGRAATVGGLVLLFAILGTAIGTCSQPRGPGKRNSSRPAVESKRGTPTDTFGRAGVGGLGATNAQTSVRSDDTNAVPTEGRSIEPARETRPGGVSTNVAPASSETPAAVTNNPAESPAIRNGETK